MEVVCRKRQRFFGSLQHCAQSLDLLTQLDFTFSHCLQFSSTVSRDRLPNPPSRFAFSNRRLLPGVCRFHKPIEL